MLNNRQEKRKFSLRMRNFNTFEPYRVGQWLNADGRGSGELL